MRRRRVAALLIAIAAVLPAAAAAEMLPLETSSVARVVRSGAASPPGVAGVEARAVELAGTGNLVCAEQLQDDGLNSILNGHDFADSPDAYECDPYGTNATSVTIVAEADMPVGNTVDRVLEIPEDGASVNWIEFDEDDIDSGVRRVVQRFYVTVDDDFSGTGWNDGLGNDSDCPSERNKIVQFGWSGSNIQLQESTFASEGECFGPVVPGVDNDYPGNAAYQDETPVQARDYTGPNLEWILSDGTSNAYPQDAGGDYMDFSRCMNSWCRVEVAAAGNIAAGTNISTEARITTLSDGEVYTAIIDNSSTMGTWQAGGNQNGADLFHGQPYGIGGWRISHFLVGQWDADGGEWVGCASEIEGEGC